MAIAVEFTPPDTMTQSINARLHEALWRQRSPLCNLHLVLYSACVQASFRFDSILADLPPPLIAAVPGTIRHTRSGHTSEANIM